ncbi:hypothetical protein [Streptomyces sp. HO565]
MQGKTRAFFQCGPRDDVAFARPDATDRDIADFRTEFVHALGFFAGP